MGYFTLVILVKLVKGKRRMVRHQCFSGLFSSVGMKNNGTQNRNPFSITKSETCACAGSRCSFWKPRYEIMDENQQTILHLQGPCCLCECPCLEIDFRVNCHTVSHIFGVYATK